MTRIEKTILVLIVVLLSIVTFNVIYIINSIYEAGGIKQVIIEAGKEIKDISKEISKD